VSENQSSLISGKVPEMVDAMNPAAVTLSRLAILFPSFSSQTLYQAGTLARLVVLSAFMLASPAQ